MTTTRMEITHRLISSMATAIRASLRQVRVISFVDATNRKVTHEPMFSMATAIGPSAWKTIVRVLHLFMPSCSYMSCRACTWAMWDMSARLLLLS